MGNRTVVRREFVEKSKSTLPPEDIKQMLQQISTYDSASRVWEFRFPTDNDFLATHPSVNQFCAKKQRSSSTKQVTAEEPWRARPAPLHYRNPSTLRSCRARTGCLFKCWISYSERLAYVTW